MKVPIAPLIGSEESGMKIRELFGNRLFWILFLMMLCAGASEQGVSQWASAFAEKGLGLSKTWGEMCIRDRSHGSPKGTPVSLQDSVDVKPW